MFLVWDLFTASVCCESAGELPFLGGEEGVAPQRTPRHEMRAQAMGIAAHDVRTRADPMLAAYGAGEVAGDDLMMLKMTDFDASAYLNGRAPALSLCASCSACFTWYLTARV